MGRCCCRCDVVVVVSSPLTVFPLEYDLVDGYVDNIDDMMARLLKQDARYRPDVALIIFDTIMFHSSILFYKTMIVPKKSANIPRDKQ